MVQSAHRKLVWQATCLASVLVATLSACKSSSESPLTPGSASKKEETGGDDEDTPDKPAPISGAYLTCGGPDPKEGDDYVQIGCQLRAKDGKKVDLSQTQHQWTYVPPKLQGVKPQTIELIDLVGEKKAFYFHVIYRMKLPKTAGLTDGAAASARAQAATFFLASRGMFVPSTRLLSQIKKTSLALTQTTGTADAAAVSEPFLHRTVKAPVNAGTAANGQPSEEIITPSVTPTIVKAADNTISLEGATLGTGVSSQTLQSDVQEWPADWIEESSTTAITEEAGQQELVLPPPEDTATPTSTDTPTGTDTGTTTGDEEWQQGATGEDEPYPLNDARLRRPMYAGRQRVAGLMEAAARAC